MRKARAASGIDPPDTDDFVWGDVMGAWVDGPNPPIPREPNRPRTSLIDEIVAAGGTLHVPVRGWNSLPGTPDYEQRVANAERRGAVPAGKRLVVTRSGDALSIDLRDAADGTPTAASPVPVLGRVGCYHRVVSEFRGLEERTRSAGHSSLVPVGSCMRSRSRPSGVATASPSPLRPGLMTGGVADRMSVAAIS